MEPRGKNQHVFLLLVVLGVFCSLIFVLHPKLASANSGEPNFYYYSSGRKIPLVLSKKMLAVRFKESIGSETKEKIVKSEPNLGSFLKRKELSIFNITLLPLRAGLREENIIQTISSLTTKSEVEAVFPLFGFPDPVRILTDEFIVKFNTNTSEEEIRAFNTLHNVEIARKPEWTDRYTLKVKDPTNMNTLRTANLYYENPITVFSMPNFIGKLKPAQITPDDTYFPQQWPLDNTGQTGGTPDADIHAPEGWEITTGSSDIVIAILDEGVDLDHNDLVNKLVPGYDFFDDDNDPSPYQDDAHGTACAGLAAAETNNGLGIAGVCWNCKIMPIRIASSEYYYWIKEEAAANGVTWATNNGADVLSCSWSELGDNDAIHDAIIDAKNNGREGKGCVLVYAAHNYNRLLTYPSKYPEVIAVGATDHNDQRWDLDCVGTNGCGSNYGPELDVVAPSGWRWDEKQVRVISWSTDISGPAGYNPGGSEDEGDIAGDYTKWMGGTSGATPKVAGLAGLILSVNPDFTSNEVQFIIESTADDKGDPGRDDDYGWGRINVQSALLEALEFPTDDTLVGWWKLDDGSGTEAEDSAGDNDGELGPDPHDPAWVEGKINGALDFDVDSEEEDYVSIAPIDALKGNTVTISAWIQVDDASASYSPIVRQYDFVAQNYFGYDLCLIDGKPSFYLDNTRAQAGDAISPNKWYHLAGTYDSQELRIYVDGALKDSALYAGESGRDTGAYMGYGVDSGGNRYFGGIIDDVRVYNWAVDRDEILDKMFYGTTKFSIKNNSGVRVAWFDNLGNLFLKGSLTERGGQTRPTATEDDEFVFKDSSGNLMIINTTNGNMDIYGVHGVWPGPGPSELEDEFVIEGPTGVVAYINASGNLYLKGELYEQNP